MGSPTKRGSCQAWALFVFLKATTGPSQVVRLEGDSKGPVQRFGIASVKPGRYDTACKKGYWECKADEPEVLELKLPSLEFFVFESASSIFWWDGESGTFRRTWISD